MSDNITRRTYVLRGVSYYDVTKALSAGHLVVGAGLRLATEQKNPFDSNAVVVSISVSGEKLGYLSRKVAPEIARALRVGHVRIARIQKANILGAGLARIAVKIGIAEAP